jgi:hypothetical protein
MVPSNSQLGNSLRLAALLQALKLNKLFIIKALAASSRSANSLVPCCPDGMQMATEWNRLRGRPKNIFPQAIGTELELTIRKFLLAV